MKEKAVVRACEQAGFASARNERISCIVISSTIGKAMGDFVPGAKQYYPSPRK